MNRQTDRRTSGGTDRPADEKVYILYTYIYRDGQQAGKQTGGRTDRQAEGNTRCSWTDRHMDGQTDIWVDRQIYGRIDRYKTDRHRQTDGQYIKADKQL